jgi:hypothetical protein
MSNNVQQLIIQHQFKIGWFGVCVVLYLLFLLLIELFT